MAGNSRTTSGSTASLEGDVYAVGDIVLKGNAEVGGDAAATGNVTLSGNAKVSGTVTQSVTALRFETPDMEDYLRESGADYPDVEAMMAEAKAVPEKRMAADYTAPDGVGLRTNGAYSWIDGDLTIGGNNSVILDGVLLVSGSITLKGNPKIVGTGVVISGSPGAAAAVKVEGDAEIAQEGGSILIIAAAGGVKVSGNADVEGAIVADGDIGLTANASSQPTGVPLAVSLSGNVEISGNGWLGARVYAPNGEVKVAGNAKVYGPLVGKSVTLSGNNQVDYPVSLRD